MNIPKRDKDNKKKGGKGSKKSRLWVNILSALLIFLVIITIYSFVEEQRRVKDEIPLSMLVADIRAGRIEHVAVMGEKLEITYTDDSQKFSKKEVGSSFSETLINYGVTTNDLSRVTIEIKNPSGIGYWLLQMMPFLIPILFIIFFFWFISRQMRVAGMQAFTFCPS